MVTIRDSAGSSFEGVRRKRSFLRVVFDKLGKPTTV